ncbi:MAG: hypothetical protein H6R14_1406 [Proteobacteria bacterium]|nr:hypothetical protein [Pseudomonadota bacterium]
MSDVPQNARQGRLIEGSLYLFEGAAAFGLISGAAFVSAIGQFLLGGILALLALAVFLRFKRRGKRRRKASQP